MDRWAAEARALEAQGRLLEARDRWLSILPLLPNDSKQSEWIRGHAHDLEGAAAAANRPAAPGTTAKRLAPLGPIALILAKFKTVLMALPQLKFLFSFSTFIAVYWSMFGPRFGIGFAVLILIHEMGHYIDIKRRGLPADMPVFFPGLGAYVRWQALGVSVETRAAISLAGPLAGCLAAGVCALIWHQTGDPLWGALARVGAWFNVLNLIPIWIFDGATAARALRKTDCVLLMLAGAGLGYAMHEGIFYFVALGSLWPLFKALMMRSPQPQQMAAYGVGSIPVAGGTAAGPYDVAAGPRLESHGIVIYFIAVLAGLALVLWLVPGHGTGIP
jgi:Zn-dependent protease